MTAVFSRRAERFGDAVAGAVSSDPSFVPLLQIVADLKDRPALEPREEFRDELRVQLVAEAETILVSAPSVSVPHPRTRARRRRLVAAVAALAVVGGTAGVATAAQSARPGQLLYPVKRAIERIESAFTPGASNRGGVLLDQADTRLLELTALTTSPDDGQAAGVVVAFTDEARRGSDLLLQTYQGAGDAAAVDTVREFAARSMDDLARLETETGGWLTDELASAALVLQQIDSQATVLCPSCSSLPALELPPSLQQSDTTTTLPDGAGTSTTSSASTSTQKARTKQKARSGTQKQPGPTSGSTPLARVTSGTTASSSPVSSPLDPVTSAVESAVTAAVSDVTNIVDTVLPSPTGSLPGLP